MNQTSKLKEQKDHGTSVFPCGLYEVFDNAPWEGVKHHWHDEIEILYFMKGNFKVKINMESFPVEEECFFFVNPGEIHSVDCSGPATESAIVFHPCILNFEHYDLAQTQLIQPLTKGEIQLPRFLDSSHPAFHKIKKEYLDILNVFHQTGMFLSSEYQTVTEDIASQLFIRAGFFKPRKADCERRLRACDEQDRNAVHREQPSNLRMGKLISLTKKPHHTMRGAVWVIIYSPSGISSGRSSGRSSCIRRFNDFKNLSPVNKLLYATFSVSSFASSTLLIIKRCILSK